MPDPLPEFDPLQKHLWLVTDTQEPAVNDVPVVDQAAPAMPATDTPEPAASVTDTPPETVTSPSVTPVTDTDADTDAGLADFEEFGEEIGRLAAFLSGLGRAANLTGTVVWDGLKDRKAWSRQPDSVRTHIEWIHDTKWIPEGHGESGAIRLLRALRFAFGYTIGLAFSAAGNAQVWLRLPQHFVAVLIAVILLDLLVLR